MNSPIDWQVARNCLAATCLLASMLAGPVLSQTYNFQHLGADDGLPQVQVFALAQDGTGYLWVGTYSGLGRYNGRGFVNYSRNDGLGSNLILALTVDGEGRLWAGTGAGLCHYQPDPDGFDCVEGDGLESAPVNVLWSDGDDVVWAGTDRGLYRVSTEGARRMGASIGSSPVLGLTGGAGGALWVGTAEGLLHRAGRGGDFAAIPMPGAGRVTALEMIGEIVWVGTSSGLYRYGQGRVEAVADLPPGWEGTDIEAIAGAGNGDLWVASSRGVLWRREHRWHALDTSSGLNNEITHALFVDREGLAWIGHDDGLTKMIPGPLLGYRTNNGLIDSFVRTIAQDAGGRLWLGTRSGVQVVGRNEDWDFSSALVLTRSDGLPDNRVYSIDFPNAREALIATGSGVARWRDGQGVVEVLTEAHGLPSNDSQSLMVDHSGGVWIGTNMGTAFLEHGEIRPVNHAQLAQAYAIRIRSDTDGRVWFATRDHGLFVLAGGEFSQFDAADGLTDETIWDLAPAGNGGMWAGTNGDGLFRVDVDGRIDQFTTADGLVDNFVWQVLEDSRGDVWAYTNHGLSRFDGQRFHAYTTDDGLLHPEGGATGAWETDDGLLWFASADGLMRYDPGFEAPALVPPPVVIEGVLQGGRKLVPGEKLPPNAGSVDVHFAALGFRSERSLEYRYRLHGAMNEWSEPMAYRPVTFANLGGGEYGFEVQARQAGGSWSPVTARFEFSVQPPFWSTGWFWSLTVMGVGLLLWFLVWLRLRAGEARRRELEAQVAERTRELETANRQLEAASITDPLTGLHNRRFLMNQIQADIAQSRRAYVGRMEHPNRDIVFMMVDLDHFKEINDTYGHLVGDQILRSYSDILRSQLRTSDYVVRWGGEEFLVVARQTEADRLNMIAERMIASARAAKFEVDGVEGGIRCTCSIGVSHFPFVRNDPDLLNWEQVVDIADCAIYVAKERGRNGWVAIHGIDGTRVTDAQDFVRRIKSDLQGLTATGEVRVESSF